jgi:hypothetical protein
MDGVKKADTLVFDVIITKLDIKQFDLYYFILIWNLIQFIISRLYIIREQRHIFVISDNDWHRNIHIG